MSTSFALINGLSSMLLMMLTGFILVRCHLLKDKDSKVLSTIIVYLLQPCLIFRALQVDLTQERIQGFFLALIFSTTVYILWILLTILLKHPLKLDPVDQATLIYGNVGNLMLPLISMTLGEEMVFYASAIQIPFNLFFWTHGISAIRRQKSLQLRKVLQNTNIIAMLFGLLFLIFQIPTPQIISATINSLANMVGPASMIVIGMVIAGKKLTHTFLQKRAYGIVLGRQILFPALAIALLYLGGIVSRFPEHAIILQALIMVLAAPPASNVSQVAVLYDENPLEAGIYNTIGTLLCIFTIPVINFLFEYLFMK